MAGASSRMEQLAMHVRKLVAFADRGRGTAPNGVRFELALTSSRRSERFSSTDVKKQNEKSSLHDTPGPPRLRRVQRSLRSQKFCAPRQPAKAATLAAAAAVEGCAASQSSGAPPRARRAVRLLLVRHGETVANRQRLLQGQGDGGVLTVHGAKQAELLATRLASHTINHIYVSDLDRCKDTAAPICRAHRHVVPIYERRIREQHYGVQEGKPWASSLAAEGAQEAAAAAGSNSSTGTSKRALRPEGGESLEDVKRRAIEFFHDELVPRFLAPEAPAPAPAPAADAAAPPLAPTVLLVTHGTFLREFVNWLLHRGGALDAGAPPVLPGVRNSALFELEVASAGPVPSTAPAEDPDPEPPGKRARASAEPAPPLPLKHAPRPAGRLLMPLRVSLVRANCVEHLAGVQRAPFSEQPSRSRERAAFERFFAPRSSRSEPTSAPVPLQGPSGPSGPASNPAPPTSAPALVPPSDAGPGAGSSLSRAAGNFGPGPPVPPRAPPPPPDVIVLD